MFFHELRQRWLYRSAFMVAGILTLTFGIAAFSAADEKKPAPKQPPKPESLVLQCDDGLLLHCVYYYGGIIEKKKKQTVPIILVHDWQGNAAQFDGLATYLQKLGHAVIVPTMRGHGKSLKFSNGSDPLDPKRLRRGDYAAMVNDIETCKKFLLKENNAGELNIELLTVVAAGEMGSVVSLMWVAADWSWPVLPGRKQGQDVKGLVLLSPRQSFKGLTSRSALMHPFIQNQTRIEPSVLLIVGSKDRKSKTETDRIYDALDNNNTKDTLIRLSENTSLSGIKMLDPRLKLDTSLNIAKFIKLRMVNRAAEFPWTLRK